MELIMKTASLGIISSVCAILLRQKVPELSYLLSICAAGGILISLLPFLKDLRELVQLSPILADKDKLYLLPVGKCLGIALVSRFASDLCRDANQIAAASAVETAGTVCAMTAALPLLGAVIKLLEELL